MMKYPINIFLVFTIILTLSQDVLVSATRFKLVIDQDGGSDDAMAIFIALLREKYFEGIQVIGITTTHGNVPEPQTFINTQRVLDAINRRDVPIYRGAPNAIISSIPTNYFSGKDGLGDIKHVTFEKIRAKSELAANALIDLSKKYRGKLVVATTGPLTNIALAIRLDPDFLGRLKQLYVGAGTFDVNIKEFNAQMDPEAYCVVTETATPDKVTFVPFSTIDNLNITKKWRETVLGSIDTNLMQVQNEFEKKALNFDNSPKWTLLDPAVLSIVDDYSLVTKFSTCSNTVGLAGKQRGVVLMEPTKSIRQANSNVVMSVNVKLYESFLYQTFSAQLN